MIYSTIVIGAGQAGLAAGYYLKKQKVPFVILEKADEIGSSWKSRYDSLILFTPSEYNHLPGLQFPLEKGRTPTKDQLAKYLKEYSTFFDFPVILNQHVLELTKKDNLFEAITQDAVFRAKNVIVATGPFESPYIPALDTKLSEKVVQLHSTYYKNSLEICLGNTLVVGGGNSGAQIAIDLSGTHNTFISSRSGLDFRPLWILGKSIFWWGELIGLFTASTSSLLGRMLRAKKDGIYGMELKELIKKGKVKVYPEIKSFSGETVEFINGEMLKVNTIIWCTGFLSNYSWIKMDNLLDNLRQLKHQEGVSTIKGLYFLGLSWQRSRSSALIMGAGKDAKFITSIIYKNG